MELSNAHVQRLASHLTHSLSVTSVDVRGNGAVGDLGVRALEVAAQGNCKLLSIKCDVAQARLQAAVLPHQVVFLDNASAYFCLLLAQCSVRDLELDLVAHIGAMAFPEYLVPRGPGIYERAKTMLLSLLQLPAPSGLRRTLRLARGTN